MRVVLLLLLARAAGAAPSPGRLVGWVYSSDGEPVPRARVSVESGEVSRVAQAGADGGFALEGLPPGSYRVEVSADEWAPRRVTMAIGSGEEATLNLVVGPRAQGGPSTRGGLLDGLPLWSRAAPAAVRLSLALRSHRGPEWQLHGFDFTHPVTGAPAVAVGLEGLAAPVVSALAPGLWAAGPGADLLPSSGSNKDEAEATARGPNPGELEAGARGPMVKDRLWFSLAGQGAEPAGGGRGRALGKVDWQVSPRHKVALVGAAAGGQASSDRAAFGGLRWESLLTDEVVAAARVSALTDAGHGAVPPLEMWTGQARVDLWFSSRFSGDHQLSLSGRGARIVTPGAAGGRGQVAVEERWKPTRRLTLGAEAALARAELLDGAAPVGGPSGRLSLAWDATGDARTAARLRAGRALVPGLACPGCPRLTRIDEAAAGLEREVWQGSPVGGELVLRRARGGAASEHEGLLAAHLRHRAGWYQLSLLSLTRVWPAPRAELTAMAGLGLTRWLSAGALILRAPRATWSPLFEEPPGPPSPGNGWLLGAQLHAELGGLLGIPAALWLDALNLTGDGGAPPFQLRAGLRVEY